MKNDFRFPVLPCISVAAGAAGLALRIWLFSSIDEKGLLPLSHPADAALYILAALTLGVLFLLRNKQPLPTVHSASYRFAGAFGCLLGALGFLWCAAANILMPAAKLATVAVVGCVIGGIALSVCAVGYFRKKESPYWLYALVTLALMLQTISQCQVWGAVSQLQEYFFPLMAAVFLILAGYYRAALASGTGKYIHLVFFSQAAAFFCLPCLLNNRPFYIGLAVWAITQAFCSIPSAKES